MVIDYHICVIDYNVSLHLYTQISNSETCNSSLSRKSSPPNFPLAISHSILVQITPYKAQNFIFFHFLSFEPIEISKNLFKWRNHRRSERALRVGVNDIPGHRKRQFLPPFPLDHCFHERNNVYGTQTSFPLIPL